jgi:hypothetical protein
MDLQWQDADRQHQLGAAVARASAERTGIDGLLTTLARWLSTSLAGCAHLTHRPGLTPTHKATSALRAESIVGL